MAGLSIQLCLLTLALLALLLQPASALLLLGRTKENKDGKEAEQPQQSQQGKNAAEMTDEQPGDWTRSQQQHQRPGRRRLESHVDGEEVLNLLQHEPVRLSLEEAQDWHHVKRRLAEARDKSGFFHRVTDAFVPPNSALRRKEREAGDKEGEEAVPSQAQGAAEGGNGSGAGEEYKLFHRTLKRRNHQQQEGRMGIEV